MYRVPKARLRLFPTRCVTTHGQEAEADAVVYLPAEQKCLVLEFRRNDTSLPVRDEVAEERLQWWRRSRFRWAALIRAPVGR